MENVFEQYWKAQFWIAGFHRNDNLFTRIFFESTIPFLEASEIFEKGEDARMKGEQCICEHCKGMKGFTWTREHILLENAISAVLNK